MKPNNVGVQDWHSDPGSIVLLDVEDVVEVPSSGGAHKARPGQTGGTIGWLSPEREMEGFGQSSDIWSVGVLLIWLYNRQHPWNQEPNPWRSGPEHERLRPRFHVLYKEAVAQFRAMGNTGEFLV